MMLLSISESIQSVGFLTGIRESALVYPIIMTTHLACIAVFGGMILMTDMRLLGLAMTGRPVSDVVKGLRAWKLTGLAIMLTAGLLLATSEAVKYSTNPFFWCKMAVLALIGVHAVAFHGSVYNKAAEAEFDRPPGIPRQAKVAAWLSLLLWSGMVIFGRLIGYYEPKTPQPKVAVTAPVVPGTVAAATFTR